MVVSRMTHVSVGAFDALLPQTAPYGVECRSNNGAMQLVATFDQPVTAGTATVAAGVAAVSGNPSFTGGIMTVNLTGVANAQTVTINLNNVVAAGGTTATTPVTFRVLSGDVNGSGSVTASDVTTVKFATNQTATKANFRCDLNISGSITASDVTTVKFAANTAVPGGGGATPNTAPTITAVAPQAAVSGQASSPVGFTVGDAESPAAQLDVTPTTDNATLLPATAVTVGGSGASRTVSVTPVAGQTGTCNVTLTVSDSLATTQTTFAVTVTAAPTVYLASLQPVAGTNSLGSGTATLTVSGDQTYAVVKWTYSNLSSALSDDALYAPGDQVLYDMPVGRSRADLQPDGTLKWTFGTGAAAALSTIQGENCYLIVETGGNPAGELRGTFKKVVGSQTFSPPGIPPAITINPPTSNDASRFLQQAAFGGTGTEINALSNSAAANASTALNDWITQQFATALPIAPDYSAAAAPTASTFSTSSVYKNVYDRVTTAQSPNVYGDNLDDNRIHEAWWRNAVTGQDQLRQRVATALSELFVVSEANDNLDGQIMGLASYYDMLGDDAFVNFRQILGDVTLHPIMGEYLNMRGNNKATAPASPNENYAREILQLFSVGLYMLQPDGSLVLDASGQPIATYDQTTITQFAQVFTGWNTNGTPVAIPTLISNGATPPVGTVANFNSYYQKPMVVTASNHSITSKTLLAYTGAATYPGAGAASFIPATSSQTATTATAELNFALDNIFNHPNVGPFVCKQLIQRLIGSNPSPAYVYRVAQKFANNGSGVRGDMKAVITAILTDYEARATVVRDDPGYGQMREPLIRIAQLLRSGKAVSKTGKWKFGHSDTSINQTILRSPTVFNFFDPHFVQPGPIQQAGLVSPEFDIIYETSIINAQNLIYTGIYANYNAADGTPLLTGTGFRGDYDGSDIYLDFSAAGNNLFNIMNGSASSQLGTTGVSGALDQLNVLLMSGQMDSTMKTRITTFVNTLSATDYIGRVKAATHLVATAAQCAAKK